MDVEVPPTEDVPEICEGTVRTTRKERIDDDLPGQA
jgi:hypothetical protein